MHEPIRQMNTSLAALLVVGVGVAAMIAPSVASAGERERLAKGEIIIKLKDIKGSDLPESTMKAVVDSPPANVWAFLKDCNKYKRHLPRTKSSKQLSRKGNVIVCRVEIDMPWPLDDLWSRTKAVHTVRADYYRRAWTLIDGTYTKNTGSWTVVPFGKDGKRSLVTYKVHAVPTTGVPKWMQRKASKSTLPSVMEAVRKASRIK